MNVYSVCDSSLYPPSWKRGDILLMEGVRFVVTANHGEQVTLKRWRWWHRVTGIMRWFP